MNNGLKAGMIAAISGVMMIGIMTIFLVGTNFSILIVAVLFFIGLMFFVVFLGSGIVTGALEERRKNKVLCQSCSREIDGESDYCMHCGEEVGKKVECSYCGALNDRVDSLCSECNALLK